MRGAYIVDRQSCSGDFKGMQVKAQTVQANIEEKDPDKETWNQIGMETEESSRCLAVQRQMFCGCREQNLRKIVTKNYSLPPAGNIPLLVFAILQYDHLELSKSKSF